VATNSPSPLLQEEKGEGRRREEGYNQAFCVRMAICYCYYYCCYYYHHHHYEYYYNSPLDTCHLLLLLRALHTVT